jgi:hypothetical protein
MEGEGVRENPKCDSWRFSKFRKRNKYHKLRDLVALENTLNFVQVIKPTRTRFFEIIQKVWEEIRENDYFRFFIIFSKVSFPPKKLRSAKGMDVVGGVEGGGSNKGVIRGNLFSEL